MSRYNATFKFLLHGFYYSSTFVINNSPKMKMCVDITPSIEKTLKIID